MSKNTQISKTKTTRNNKGKRSMGQVLKLVLQLSVLFVLIVILGAMFYFYHNYGKTILALQSEAKQKVSESDSSTFRSAQTGLVYDAGGKLISTLKSEKDAYYLEYDKIPTTVVDAMVVSEDKKYFEHAGVDYLANVRAAIELIKHKGEITQGASTITQQLARNVFLTHKVTYERKIEEIFIAQELEKKYSKTEILEYYLNDIYFANGHYGIQAAAQAYFSQDISSLSMSQMVFLCAIPNNPNLYNPLTNRNNTLKRRDRILLQMKEDGIITASEYDQAVGEKITLVQSKSNKNNYVETYVYYSAIRALMKAQGFPLRYQFENEEDKTSYEEAYDTYYYSCQKDLYVKGYRIYTSIDLQKQELLQAAVDKALEGFTAVNEEGVFRMQGAAVCIDNNSGKVVAIVGGRDQNLAGYTLNRAYQSFRQPGSSIKPLIVYTPSFERNYYPDSIVVDERIEGGPKNAGNDYDGKMKLKRAIELSKNTVAWKLFGELTPQVGLSYLKNMNFTKIKDSDYVPAAALGGLTIGVSPLEMAAAYETMESDGFYREPTCILRITDSEGNEIVDGSTEVKQIYQTNAARIMTEVLTGVITNGTAKGLGLTNTVSAGKTGTTDDKKDGWFVGYTPYYTTSVWVGYDMPQTVDDLKGATYPGTIWHDYMEQIHTPAMTEGFDTYDWKAARKEDKVQQAIERAEQEAIQKEAEMKAHQAEDSIESDQQNVIPDSSGSAAETEAGNQISDPPSEATEDQSQDISGENSPDTSGEDNTEVSGADEETITDGSDTGDPEDAEDGNTGNATEDTEGTGSSDENGNSVDSSVDGVANDSLQNDGGLDAGNADATGQGSAP